VVNSKERLVGVVPLRKLITSPVEKTIGELMNPAVVAVRADTDQEEVARLVSRYDFFAIPVADDAGRLLGIITADDAVDILEEEYTEDAQRFGGSQPLEMEYLSTKISTVFSKRIGWLLVLFMTEMLTGSVMRLYESELQAVVALAFFIPLMIGTGGNSGSQTTATIIRAIAVGEVQFRDGLRLLWHETRIGLMLGVVIGVVGYLRAVMWGSSSRLALTVASALLIIVIWANVIGSLLPLLASRLKIDPAVISGPVMSTLVDATGLMIYFTLARSIMGL
jgi:magnesium transporter